MSNNPVIEIPQFINDTLDIDSTVFENLGNYLNEEYIKKENTPPPVVIQRVVDSAIHLLGSKQDIVHTTHRILDDSEEWDLAVMDGHGSTMDINPYTGKEETHNLTLCVIQEMISNGTLDEIMARDIYSSDDPAVVFQRYLSKKCGEFKRGMTQVGATFSLIQIRHDFITAKITVNVLTVGDSPVIIHRNGEKVLESIAHNWRNLTELDRLRKEGRLNKEETKLSNTFKFLDDNILVADPTYYICAGPCKLAISQSLGHIEYINESVVDETGIFGLSPFKATMVFDDTDELNIKGYSDGVSDVVVDYLMIDAEFLKKSNATQTANYAKLKWENKWCAVSKTVYDKAIKEGRTLAHVPKSVFRFGNTADDVSCVSWIQTKNKIQTKK